VTLPGTPATDLRTELTVSGMTCGHCVRHVQDALAGLPGVSAVVDLDAAVAVVAHPAAVPVQALLDAVDEAGYEAAVRAPALP
jgi:copper chaperone CopZ